MPAQIRLSIGESWSRSCRRCRCLRTPSAAALATTAAASATLTRRCRAATATRTSRAGGRAALLTRGGLNGSKDLHHNQGRKNNCQDND